MAPSERAAESGGIELRENIRAAGRGLGFARVGFAAAVEPAGSRRLLEWLVRGYHGGMAWMARDPEARLDPGCILPGARSVVAVALPYRHRAPAPVTGTPRISCYAWGDDYHDIVGEKLRALEQAIHAEVARVRAAGTELPDRLLTRVACDTSPVMDKAWAAAAGIGWLGKNACIIDPGSGSWHFLGEIFTTLPLPPDLPVADRCGRCTRCLDACPTSAFAGPYVLDARRCVSYLTIEHREAFDDREARLLGDWIVGCDICQEVCPWNRRAPVSDDARFAPRRDLVSRTAAEWEALDDEACRAAVRGTAITRVKPWMMRRNASAYLDRRREGHGSS